MTPHAAKSSSHQIFCKVSYSLASLVALLIPVIYFAAGYQFELGAVQNHVSISAALVAQNATDASAIAQPDRLGLNGLTPWRDAGEHQERHRIHDAGRRLIAQTPAPTAPAWPVVRHEEPIQYGARVIGYYSIERSIHSLFIESLLIGSASILFSWLAAALLNAFHLRRDRMRLAYLSHYDGLTGLPNLIMFREQLARSISAAERRGHMLGLLFMDIDGFKNINESFGHGSGDQVLEGVAQRLHHALSASDIVARLGSDQFTVLISEVPTVSEIASIAENVLRRLEAPFNVNGRDVDITCSIGIAVYPDDASDAESLLRFADIAMYYVKKTTRNNYHFFSAEMNTQVEERLQLDHSLRQAMRRRELSLHYQPLYDLRSGRFFGMEALLRWNSPEYGPVPPDRFISRLEDTGLIVTVGEWALREACSQTREWNEQGLPPLVVSVNVSARQFRANGIIQTIAQILQETGLPAQQLQLELTESVLMEDSDSNVARLAELQSMGIRVAVDDFGTGYSSLNYLKRFSLSSLKIDQSFVRDMVSDADDATIVTAIIQLAHNLRLSVTAEGVENEAQLQLLRQLGCNQVQGYLLSRPLDAEAFRAFMLEQQAPDIASHAIQLRNISPSRK